MVRQGLPPLPFFEYLGIRMIRTRRGEEKAPVTVVAPKMILMSYKVVDNVLWRVEGVGPFSSAYPRPGISTLAVKSKGGIYVIIERDNNRGGLWRKQVFRGSRFERAAYTYRSCVISTSNRNLRRCNV